MARRGFWNGMVTGGVLGTLIGMALSPRRDRVGRIRRLSRNGSEMVSDMADSVGNMVRRRMK